MEDPITVQSAVRLPTPPPPGSLPIQTMVKRKRSLSHSPSPLRRRPSPSLDHKHEAGQGESGKQERRRGRGMMDKFTTQASESAAMNLTDEKKQAIAKKEYESLLNMRSGGTYIPPARLRALQAQITDRTSKEYQRMSWEALKKSINGLINKVNVSNIKHIVPELFGENLIRGRGLFCRSIMKAQSASLPFTPIYAAMVAIVNTKLSQVGELLLSRLILQFKKAFRRNDKAVCISSTTFIAHLCNQQVAHETLAAQILLLLLHRPTDDSVEIAVGLTREIGQHLEEMSGQIALVVYDQFRNILHEQDLDKRVQYMIEVLFQVRKDRYKDNPAIKEELDLVEEEDQITHQIGLDDSIEAQETLNVFKYNAEWESHEEAYKKLKAEVLGEASGSEIEDDGESDESSDDEEPNEEKVMEIKDQSNTDLVNLRRTIYLTIMSSIDFEECCHKLMKLNLPIGQEPELPSMIIECCSQERTYSKFYGLVGERFAKLNRLWTELFESSFVKYYDTIHRYETSRLRNIARFFGHMLSSDGIGWHVLSTVHLNEDETTSSSRIFIKILFQDLVEVLGMPKLLVRLKDDILRPSFQGIFPIENPRNTRFSINYFTSIGMGAVTEEMRDRLRSIPTPALPALPATQSASESVSESVPSYSSYTGSSRSYSRNRSRSYTRSRSRSISSNSLRKEAHQRTYSQLSSRLPPLRKSRHRRHDSRSSDSSTSQSSFDSPSRFQNNRPRNQPRSVSQSAHRFQGRTDSHFTSPSPPRQHGSRRLSAKGRRDSYSRSRSPLPYRQERAKRDSHSGPRSLPKQRRDSSSLDYRERHRTRTRGGSSGHSEKLGKESNTRTERRRAADYL